MSSWWSRLRNGLGGTADPTTIREPVDCDEVMRVLQSYLDGELRIGADEVAAHLEACRHCDVEAATYERIHAALVRPVEGAIDEASLARLRAFATDLGDSPPQPPREQAPGS